MTQFTVNTRRFDPYKDFKFRVKWEGGQVAGVSKAGGLKRTTEVVTHRSGGARLSRKSPGRTAPQVVLGFADVFLDSAAESGAGVLWFDEAGALFGKRSEVKDSHDRYSNIEVNYLLQRMEAFSGMASLATNMKGALDSAFARRLRYIVKFPTPGLVEREAIWRRVVPRGFARSGIDLPRLASFDLTGATIHSIQAITIELEPSGWARFRSLLMADGRHEQVEVSPVDNRG